MASKFHNRLVGTLILVVLGVITLPILLDGKKKHYADELVTIPLMPKSEGNQNRKQLPPASHSLPLPTPSSREAVVQTVSPMLSAANPAKKHASQPVIVTPSPISLPTNSTPVVGRNTLNTKPLVDKSVVTPKPEMTPKTQPQPTETESVGLTYVIQLRALKNAAKANEIIVLLRLSGYQAFTVPATPIHGQITRLYVGPEASKQKLKSMLQELNTLTSLSGQVKTYGN